MSNTPRTDAVRLPINSHTFRSDIVYASFARELERELTAAQAENAELRAKCERLLDAHEHINGTTMSHVASYEHGFERCRTIARTAIAEYKAASKKGAT